MSVTLIELVNFLNSKTTNINDYISSLKQFKKIDEKMYNEYKFQVTNFSYGDTLNNLLFCLLYNNTIPGFENHLISDNLDQFDRNIILLNDPIVTECRNNIIDYLNNENNNLPFSKKKLITLINNNQYNHEIILIICMMYDVNIFIFYKDINLFKLYYPENNLITNKQNIFLQYSKDTFSSSNTFQNLYIENNNHKQHIFKWSNISHIVDQHKKHIYPIGITENKELIIDDNTDNSTNTFKNILLSEKEDIKNTKKINANSHLLKKYIFTDAKITDMKTYHKIINSNIIRIDFSN
jgi:hypothetical protein